jgi:hypothetical protein
VGWPNAASGGYTVEDSMGPALTDPWLALEAAPAAALEREAAAEIGPGHPLSGHALTFIAACSACDSAAFRGPSCSERTAEDKIGSRLAPKTGHRGIDQRHSRTRLWS